MIKLTEESIRESFDYFGIILKPVDDITEIEEYFKEILQVVQRTRQAFVV